MSLCWSKCAGLSELRSFAMFKDFLGGSFCFKLKSQNTTALFFMCVIHLSLPKNYIHRRNVFPHLTI